MVLVFEASSSLAMFRKAYTTSSRVSYPFCPPTAVAGLLSAITGIDNGADSEASNALFWEKIKGTQVTLRIMSPISWFSTAVNLIQFKSPSGHMDNHTRSMFQFIKKPRYRIYVKKGQLYSELKKRLSRGECIFTPYLGIASAVAEIDFLGEFEEQVLNEEAPAVWSVLPAAEGLKIDMKNTESVFRERVPFVQETNRSFAGAVEVYYGGSRGNGPVCVKDRGAVEISKVGGENIAWFLPW